MIIEGAGDDNEELSENVVFDNDRSLWSKGNMLADNEIIPKAE